MCVGEGEEYDGRVAFGGQERSIYAAVALDQAASTRPRQGRRRPGRRPGRMIGYFIDDAQIHFHLQLLGKKASSATLFRIILMLRKE